MLGWMRREAMKACYNAPRTVECTQHQERWMSGLSRTPGKRV